MFFLFGADKNWISQISTVVIQQSANFKNKKKNIFVKILKIFILFQYYFLENNNI